ncbi:hypothetical protein N665_1268s0009 [Sinapis alba]|nr:hypothetical protein N665_1268s0009 [Sinapis alba]
MQIISRINDPIRVKIRTQINIFPQYLNFLPLIPSLRKPISFKHPHNFRHLWSLHRRPLRAKQRHLNHLFQFPLLIVCLKIWIHQHL